MADEERTFTTGGAPKVGKIKKEAMDPYLASFLHAQLNPTGNPLIGSKCRHSLLERGTVIKLKCPPEQLTPEGEPVREYLESVGWETDDEGLFYSRGHEWFVAAITYMYTLLLDREPDEGGLAYWVDMWETSPSTPTLEIRSRFRAAAKASGELSR